MGSLEMSPNTRHLVEPHPPIKLAADFPNFRKILILIWPLLVGRYIFVSVCGSEVVCSIFVNWKPSGVWRREKEECILVGEQSEVRMVAHNKVMKGKSSLNT